MVWWLIVIGINFGLLRDRTAEHTYVVQEKLNTLLRMYPELRNYWSRPMVPGLLDRHRKGDVDTVRVLAIRVEFIEHPEDSLATGNGKFRLTPNDEPPFDTAGHNLYFDPAHTKRYFEHLLEFLHNYYYATSQGKLWIEYRVVPDAESLAYQLPYQIYYYGDPDHYVEGLLTLLRDALIACDLQDTVTMSNYDAFIVFHPGCSWQAQAAWGDTPYDILTGSIIGLDGYFGTPVYVDGGYPINAGIIMSESDFKYGVPSFLQGALAHEFGHLLGFYDLYDVSGECVGMGGWALMGTGNWNLMGLLPPHVSAWHTEKAGWIEPIEIRHDTTIQIYRRGGRDWTKPKLFRVPINAHEYYLLEVRFAYANPDTHKYIEIHSADSTLHYDSSGVRVWKDGVLVRFDDYDWGLPCDSMQGGVAIWHIDCDKIASDSLYNEINAGWPKGVDLEEADGIQDFELGWYDITNITAAFYGTPWDMFYSPSAPEFTPWTAPNTDANHGGKTHIHMEFGPSDTLMEVTVRFTMLCEGFPQEVVSFYDVASPIGWQYNGDRYWVVAGMDTMLHMGSGFGARLRVYMGDSLIWERIVPDCNIYASPSVGDVTGDGTPDIVLPVFYAYAMYGKGVTKLCGLKEVLKDTLLYIEGAVYVWEIDGHPVDGFPQYTLGRMVAPALLHDINGDGDCEILVCSDNHLYVFEGDGSMVGGFPVDLPQWVWGTPNYYRDTIYVLVGDGALYKIANDGTLCGRYLEPKLPFSSSTPVCGDINGDGGIEWIVLRQMTAIAVMDAAGNVLWQQELPDTTFYSTPAIGDIDGDSLPEIVVAGFHKLMVYNHNGAMKTGFPVEYDPTGMSEGSPVIVDLDRDGQKEIIVSSSAGKLYAFNYRGECVTGFPLDIGVGSYSTPLVMDIDNDDRVELILGNDDGEIMVWKLGRPATIEWGMQHGNANHLATYKGYMVQPPGADVFISAPLYVYPNPVKRWAKLHYALGEGTKRVKIQIFNTAGDLLREFNGKVVDHGAVDMELPITGLTNGAYMLRVEVTTDKGKTLHKFYKFAIVRE